MTGGFVRLSRSLLWALQRAYFERRGLGAWAPGEIPHQVTSSPFAAAALARVAAGFIRDWSPVLDPSQPVYVVELGAGSGRFAHRFVRALEGLAGPRVVYVMSDFAERTLREWEAHPALGPLLCNGRLEIARLDCPDVGCVRLRRSGVVLEAGSLTNPLVVVANYVFDSVPQDAFRVRSGGLAECLCAVDLHGGDAEPLERLRVAYETREATDAPYGDPELDALLAHYRQRLVDTVVTIPAVALQTLRTLRRLSGDRLLLLAADKAFSTEAALEGESEPVINVHGSVSLTVNFHALGWYTERHGGEVLHTGDRQTAINVSAFLFGAPPAGYRATRTAYAEAIERFGPDDYVRLTRGLELVADQLSVEVLLAWLRLSRWDPYVFALAFPRLLAHAGPSHAPELIHAIGGTLENDYPLPGEPDIPFRLGAILYAIDRPRDALALFRRSVDQQGPDARTSYNMALCHDDLGERDDALRCLDEAVRLDPNLEPARMLGRSLAGRELESSWARSAPSRSARCA